MEAQKCLVFALVVTMFLVAVSEAREFWVGGRDGWVLNPSEGYSHWAQRMRFQVNDTLSNQYSLAEIFDLFKLKSGSNSVLVVDKNAYYRCTKSNPMQNLTAPQSEYKFNHSGPFYFISGEADNCLKGQKLETVVMAVRHHPHATSPPPALGPGAQASSLSPAPASSSATKILSCGGVFFGFVFLVLGFI